MRVHEKGKWTDAEGRAARILGVVFTLPPLFSREELRAAGVGPRQMGRMLGSGELVRLRPGVYLRVDPECPPTPEEWITARARALARMSVEPPLFSHLTAAALHGLPVRAPISPKVHITLPPERPGAQSLVVRHRGEVPDEQQVQRHGIRFTSLERTMADVARTAPFDIAVCTLDAAFRPVTVPKPGVHDIAAAENLREEVLEIVARSAHGRARAIRALTFADGRAQLPGESISRIRLMELGFTRVDLQVQVAGPSGQQYHVDFGLDDVKAWGEFDGEQKYRDEAMRSGLTLEEVLLREKQREDWIRGVTQRPFARWKWAHLRSADTLARRLASFGIRPR